MKKIILVTVFLLIGILAVVMTDKKTKLFPAFDLTLPSPLPKSARFLHQPFETTLAGIPHRKGLDLLRVAASGQFTEYSLLFMKNRLPDQMTVVVVDLREESHGFVNGLPISWELPHTTWTNRGKTLDEVEKDESERLHDLFKQGFVILDPDTSPLKIEIGHVQTEKELVEAMGMRYVRIPITENHSPTDAQVDQLVNLMLNLPSNEWLYAHCHGGRGRATMFTAMYDILMNHDHFTLEEILMRQMLLGGTDLTRLHTEADFRHQVVKERLDFFHTFYEYAKAKGPGRISFAKWRFKQNS